MFSRMSRRLQYLLTAALFVFSCHSVGAYAASFHTRSAVVQGKSQQRSGKTFLTTTASNEEFDDVPRGGGFNDLPRNPPALPALSQYRKFAIPCLGLWIAGPLLSLVDTSFVGLSGAADQSAKQLAALGPATTFFDGATYVSCERCVTNSRTIIVDAF